MRLILLPELFYELVRENFEGESSSQYFISENILESREMALNTFLETVFTDIRVDEVFVTIYMHHLKSGCRIEILSTASYENPGETLKALEKELEWYQKLNIATNVAIYNHDIPQKITIMWPRFRNAHLLVNQSTSVLLASMYWVFLQKKKERYMIA